MVNFYHQAFSKIAIQTGASPEQVESISWRFNDQVCRGEMSVEQFNQELAKALGVSQIDWQHFYMSTVQPIEEAQACFEWAKEHYQVGLLSNIFPGFIEDMQTRGILPKLDNVTVVDSSRVGVIKPEIKIYDIATNRAGVPPESILFIDDSRTNLIAAERFGWRGLWFDDFRPAESANRIRTALEF
ncbi:HAD-IA family hydrolase [Candidatus Saccharibacteria bacterium]|nr:HAD-IA family hydrolase [Candidatus Saccharibacteria bacterium]MCB9821137.1 HAD-IA family hydrolase [Candidatus Nomurabacteria bacterium]